MAAASYIPDPEAWEPWRPDEVAAALASLPVPWAVAGGWAIDLHLQRETRPHHDIEIAISRDHMEVLAARLADLEWFAIGDGRAWPLADAPPDGLHQTWGRDRSRLRWRLDVFRENWGSDDWVYRRDPRVRRRLSEAIESTPDGIPYLAPELVLLFKAKAPQDKDEADLRVTLPTLCPERVDWLRTTLQLLYCNHKWIPRLTPAL